MKDKMNNNGIEYVRVEDYYIPALKLPDEERQSENLVGCTVIISKSNTL